MNTQAFIRWMIDTLSDDATKLAESVASRAHSHEEYLVTVGKYRQIQVIIGKLQERLAKGDAAMAGDDDFDEAPEEPKRSEPERRPATRRPSTPRSWGGGR